MVAAIPIIGGVAVAGILGLALVVWITGRANPQGRVLTLLLFLEAMFLLHVPLLVYPLSSPPVWAETLGALSFFIPVGMLPGVYLALLSFLDTPVARRLRPRRDTLVVLAAASSAVVVLLASAETFTAAPVPEWIAAPFLLVYAAVLVFALAVSISAWRRAARGTVARSRAGAFALAFGMKDLFFILAILVSIVLNYIGRPVGPLTPQAGAPLLAAIGGVLYAALLAYGILRTQLFDLDLKVKWTIQRSTVITVFLAVFFVVAKVAEFYLNKVYGYVLGGVAAGLMLFLAPRVNKLGDRVADTAMPTVQPTSAYLVAKKIEVYRAAVETTIETGGIDARERVKLDRLRAKLGLSEADAGAVESDVSVRPSAAGA